jgi:hypothetical protein
VNYERFVSRQKISSWKGKKSSLKKTKNKRKNKSTQGLEKPEGRNTGCRLVFEENYFGNFC